MKKFFTLIILTMTILSGLRAQPKNLLILLVSDNDKAPSITDTIRHAITASGYSYVDYNVLTSGSPAIDVLNAYELVIWSTGNDATDNFWSGELPSGGIKEYLDNGGMLWLEGIDFMYDGYGSAPDTFEVGDFAYDYLGIEQYQAQAYYNDGNIGLPMMVVNEANGICTIDTVTWRWSTMWGADAFLPTSNAKTIYKMGPSDYQFADKACVIYNEIGNAKILSAAIRWDGFKTYELGVSLTSEILDYFNKFSVASIVKAESIEITGGTEINENNGTLQLTATVLPESTTNKTISWSLGEESVFASISADGLLTASGLDNGNGKVYVIAKTNDGTELSDTVEVTITNQTLGEGFKVLLVNDDARDYTYYLDIDSALVAGEYNYKVYDITKTLQIPSFNYLSNFDFVIWYAARNGVDLYFWDVSDSASIKCNAPLKQYADEGGIVWLQGRDVFYDIWRNYSAKNEEGDSIIMGFNQGEFVYDYLGIKSYVAQSYVNETSGTYKGCPQLDLDKDNNPMNNLDPIKWIWAEAQYIDAFETTDSATSLYYLGPTTYDFSLYYSMLYNKNGEAKFITSGYDPSKIDTQDNLNTHTKEVIDYFIEKHTGIFQKENTGIALNIYPNPANSTINIELGNIPTENLQLKAVDLAGRVVLEKSWNKTNISKNLSIDVSHLINGIYQITVNTASERTSKSFIIVK